MTEKTRIAVIGVGVWGRNHALSYTRMPNVDLVAVVDADPAAAQRVAAECGCAAFRHHREILDRVDAADVAVPTIFHREVAVDLLEHGLPVFVEKPLAANCEDGEAILAAAEARGLLVQVGHIERFNPGIMALAERIRAPRFIECHRIGTFTGRATDVDVVSDLMIHDIDIVLSLVDAELRTVAAAGAAVLTNHVDIANARLEFENGAVANITASRVSDKRLRRMRVFGKDQYLALDFIDQQLETITAQHEPGADWPTLSREQVALQPRPSLDVELAAFIESVRTGKPPLVSGRVGLKALEVALKVKDCITP